MSACPRDTIADKAEALAAVTENGSALYRVSANLKKDKEVVLAAVRNQARSLLYADINLQFDGGFMLEAVKYNPDAFQYANKWISDCHPHYEAMVLTAVQKKGRLLNFAAENYQGNKEVVLAAVTQDGDALQYASKELREDRDVVYAALYSENKQSNPLKGSDDDGDDDEGSDDDGDDDDTPLMELQRQYNKRNTGAKEPCLRI